MRFNGAMSTQLALSVQEVHDDHLFVLQRPAFQ